MVKNPISDLALQAMAVLLIMTAPATARPDRPQGPGGDAAAARPQAATPARESVVTLSDGSRVRYEVILPDGYEPGRSYPTILAFPPGDQGPGMVEAGLRRYWAVEGRRRGYVVISPSTPNGQPFFQGADAIFPEFLDAMREAYPPAGGRFHLTGVSNGGISALHVAARYPGYFRSVLAMPGFLDEPTDQAYRALGGLCLVFVVGERDTEWVERARRDHAALTALGQTPLLRVVPGDGHVVASYADANAGRAFDLIDGRAGCAP